MVAELQCDQAAVDKYLKDKVLHGKSWDAAVAKYKTKRYNKGVEACGHFMEERLDLSDIPDPKHIMREFTQFKRKLEG
eukprot:7445805-Alexandrium_andersonii.AAC.1